MQGGLKLADQIKGSLLGVKRTRLVLMGVLVVAIIGGWYLLQPKGSEGIDFTLVDLDGEVFRLSDYRGSVVLLDFMATWCGPCRASVPDLISIYGELGDRIVMVSISVDPVHDTDSVLEEWRREWEAEWIHARDLADPPVSQLFDVKGIPTYCLIDKEGVARFRHVGLTPEETLRTELLKLLNE